MTTLLDRQKAYEKNYDYTIIKGIPIIIKIDGRNFANLTKNLKKPFCQDVSHAMMHSMYETIKEIDGALFGYTQNDKITFILKNDQNSEITPWFNNKIQKIASVTASIVSNHFNKSGILNLASFVSHVFAVPNITEAINNLISVQQEWYHESIFLSSRVELGKLYGKNKAFQILDKKNSDERIELLKSECDINYFTDYPSIFRIGAGTYKVPKVIKTHDGEMSSHKWVLDASIPLFIQQRTFLMNILTTGSDVFRPKRDLIEP